MKIIHFTEQEERAYLEQILQKLEWALHHADQAAKQFTKDFRQNEEYLYDQRSGMDDADHVSAGQSFKRMAFEGESTIAAKRRLTKLMESPYFGRIDFTPTMEAFVGAGPTTEPLVLASPEALPIYIGVHSFVDGMKGSYLIYDWRAPVSSMFYDFELGAAWYETAAGTVKGSIGLRRQYRIRRGKMEYMIENDLNIQDDVLQKELSQSSDDKMKNIVATIQRDQNAIIRNESSPVLIIQGVAGSGKTSIAIHRIAFLLYRFRDTMASRDILIISPNKVFADYISNVLPELGETQIPELGMEEFASDLLDHKYKFHSFLQQTFSIIQKNDEGFLERVRFKSSAELVGQFNRYLVHLENHLFVASDLLVGQIRVSASFIREQFKSLQRVPLLSRLPMVIKAVEQHVKSSLRRKLSGPEKSHLYKSLSGAWGNVNLLELYRQFYDWLGRNDLFRMDHNVLEYTDVFPLIYCKIRLVGMREYQEVKHLVVDEMQDYTPIQYAVLARLFPCKKTILGDANQAVNPYSVSIAVEIHQIFPQADVVKLFRSYRSTYEITRFTQGIMANPDLVAVERHGPEPEVKGFQGSKEEEDEIKRIVTCFRGSRHQSLAIICKTPQQAKAMSKLLHATDVFLLTEESTSFRAGVVITTIPLAKGLEFDEVLVPFASADQYQTDLDKRLLYIACTRALHQLTLTFTKERSGFLAFAEKV